MIVPRQLDLDRLHDATEAVLDGKPRRHRQGTTVAYVMMMVGEVELGGRQNTYLYVGQNAYFTSRVLRDFRRVVSELLPAVPITVYTQSRVTIGGTQTFLFHSIERLIESPSLVKGWSLDRIFMDADDVTQTRLDADGKLSQLYQQLLPQLSYKRGDVI